MSLIARVIRFSRHDIGWLLAAWPALLAFLIYRYRTLASAAILLGIYLLCFCLPYVIRSVVILNYRSYQRPMSTMFYVVIAVIIVMRVVGHYQVFQFAIAAYFSLSLGLIFWAASDPMFEMVDWLAFPTEFGRFPDEIQVFDTRRINWPGRDYPIRAHRYRFRYDGDWAYGITGPLTFALGDQDFEGKSPKEIYSAYADWYAKEDIRGILEKTTESE